MTDPVLIALDWGTSSLRAYLLGQEGRILDSYSAAAGVVKLEPGEFPDAFEAATGAWRARWPGLRAIACGMVGSNAGWVEAPYATCPASPEDLATRLIEVPGAGLLIVPGIAQHGEAADVMRGEETQIFGGLWMHPDLRTRTRVVHPGTHSKWIDIEDGRLQRFNTYMTGEVYAVLREHSILGRFAKDAPPPSDEAAREAFERGVHAVRRGGHLAPLLFSTRALVLTGQMRPEQALDYLSGLLIGEEIGYALATGPRDLVLMGDLDLCARYRHAMGLFGLPEIPIIDGADAATNGLWHIALLAGLQLENSA